MIEFIIYEEEVGINNYKYLILNVFGGREDEFKIRDYYSDIKLDGNKIFILDSNNVDVINKIASKIRSADDWDSQIIVIGKKCEKLLHNKLLILDFISEDCNFEINFKKALYMAYKILTIKKSFNFFCDGQIYNIPYKDILYFEKNNNQNYCDLYTKNGNYVVKSTIKDIEKELDSFYFMRTHRSCIVNVDNITSFNYIDNIISFDERKIYLVTREKKQFLKEKLINNK